MALRGGERLEHEVELAEKIDPYEFPFLGILPLRFSADEEAPGVVVRYVYPDSPAALAGIKPLDRLKSIESKEIVTLDALQQQLQTHAPGDKLHIEVARGSETIALEAQLARLPESLPGELPAAHGPLPPRADGAAEGEARPPVGVTSLKFPEFENECLVYVPESYDPRLAYGVVVWLHAPGGVKSDELVELWKPLCDANELILVAPKSVDRTKWQATEARFIRRALDDVAKNYTTDPARVVVHGHEGGGAMAYLFASANDDVVRAVAVVDAPLPRLVQLPPTDPVHRLAFYTTLASKSEIAGAVEATVKRLREMKYPVVVQDVGEQGRYLTRDELAELVRWFDTLDRK